MGYNMATQTRCPGGCISTPRTWPTGVDPVDVHDLTSVSAAIIERFWSKVDRSAGPDACWPWRGGARGPNGYGGFWAAPRKVYAHRFAYLLTFGAVPPGLFVMHACDSPRCCNPAHLSAGAHSDNMADMRRRGRAATGSRNGNRTHPEAHPRGEASATARLTEVDVRAIRRRQAAGETMNALAREYGVGKSQIGRIVSGEKWAHVPLDPA